MVHARYKGVVDALAADIRAGKIPPGTRLPTIVNSPPEKGWHW